MTAPAPDAAVADPQQQQQGGGGGGGWLQQILRMFSYWVMIQMALSVIFPSAGSNNNQRSAPAAGEVTDGDGDSPAASSAVAKPAALPERMVPHWREYSEGKLELFLVENRSDHDALRDPKVVAAATPVHTFARVRHTADAAEQSVNVTLDLEDCAKRNCTLFLHARLSNPKLYSSTYCLPFTRFTTVRRSRLRHLFGGSGANSSSASTPGEEEAVAATKTPSEETPMASESGGRDDVVVAQPAASATASASADATPAAASEYRTIGTVPPEITINVVADWSRWEGKSVPPAMQPYIRPISSRNNVQRSTAGGGSDGGALAEGRPGIDIGAPVTLGPAQYPPILFLNEFWVLDEYRVPFNTTSAKSVNLTVTTKPLTLFYFLAYVSFTQQMESQMQWGVQSSSGFDEVKRMLLETEPWLLITTMVVSLLHMFFEYLTFSSDVQFWRGRKNFKGLSLQAVALSCYMQTVIFLFLFDGNETSYTILLPSGIGVLIEYWKLKKTIVFERMQGAAADAAPLWMFWRRFTWRSASSYDSQTRGFDQQAMRYLMMVMMPCLLGYSVYSAVYDQHKGWYSFLIRTQVRFIYWFGFAKMTPQIFINYKLKTVPNMPVRAFVYKILNTVIDDFFAFIIKQPTMSRMAAFRDDVVFIIVLYQRWIYPVDESRTAEDGDGADEAPADKDKAAAIEEQPAAAAAAAASAAADEIKETVKQVGEDDDDEAEEEAAEDNKRSAQKNKGNQTRATDID